MRWSEIERHQPGLAELGRKRLLDPGVVLVVTIRRDGTPRLSPVEPFVMDGALWLSMMWQSKEARQVGIRHGTLRGLAVTGGVITAAGLVMAGTFGDLARLPYVPVTEVGIAVAVGVLLDTLFVRTVLVPASLLAIGQRVWWPARPASPAAAGNGTSSSPS
jgi:MMPL family